MLQKGNMRNEVEIIKSSKEPLACIFEVLTCLVSVLFKSQREKRMKLSNFALPVIIFQWILPWIWKGFSHEIWFVMYVSECCDQCNMQLPFCCCRNWNFNSGYSFNILYSFALKGPHFVFICDTDVSSFTNSLSCKFVALMLVNFIQSVTAYFIRTFEEILYDCQFFQRCCCLRHY